MNKLISALGKDKKVKTEQSVSNNLSMMKSFKGKDSNSIWLLDVENDNDIEQGNDVNTKFITVVQALVQKKFQTEKYLEEYEQIQEIFQEIINQLRQNLQDVPTQLAKLIRIQTAIAQISDTYIGEIKNYLKNFQSLLDVRIRKLKRKQKKSDLSEFDKIMHDKQLMKKKHQVMYIDEDRDQKKHIHRKENRIKNGKIYQAESKKSYGTMNSGSNENQSESGRKSGGSQSRSSEGNALAVLLSNRDPKRKDDQKSEKNYQKTVNESYDFSAIMSSSVAVRQRTDKKPQPKHQDFNQTIHHVVQNKVNKKDSASDQKDEAFIFHRPKKVKKLHL